MYLEAAHLKKNKKSDIYMKFHCVQCFEYLDQNNFSGLVNKKKSDSENGKLRY